MRTKTPLMLMLITIPLAFAACVPTAKYDEALAAGAALQLDLDVSEAARRAAEAEGERLGQALADETTRREALDSLVEVLRERNDTLKQELQRLSDQLTDITASSRRDRERKAALEELVAHLQDTSAETERQMLEAEQRIADLKAEREVLLAEKEVLEEKTSEYDALVDSLQSEIQAGR